jgi:hypothetical protein
MTRLKTVLLWGQDDLLTEAMELFLTAGQKKTWEVIRLPAGQSFSLLVEQVQQMQPELLILYLRKTYDDSDPLMKLIQEHPELGVIADQPQLKVIIVSLEDNVMQVYSKQSITVRRVSDLLSVIEDRYFSENSVEKEETTGSKIVV